MHLVHKTHAHEIHSVRVIMSAYVDNKYPCSEHHLLCISYQVEWSLGPAATDRRVKMSSLHGRCQKCFLRKS
jgi:hypothetical protein